MSRRSSETRLSFVKQSPGMTVTRTDSNPIEIGPMRKQSATRERRHSWMTKMQGLTRYKVWQARRFSVSDGLLMYSDLEDEEPKAWMDLQLCDDISMVRDEDIGEMVIRMQFGAHGHVDFRASKPPKRRSSRRDSRRGSGTRRGSQAGSLGVAGGAAGLGAAMDQTVIAHHSFEEQFRLLQTAVDAARAKGEPGAPPSAGALELPVQPSDARLVELAKRRVIYISGLPADDAQPPKSTVLSQQCTVDNVVHFVKLLLKGELEKRGQTLEPPFGIKFIREWGRHPHHGNPKQEELKIKKGSREPGAIWATDIHTQFDGGLDGASVPREADGDVKLTSAEVWFEGNYRRVFCTRCKRTDWVLQPSDNPADGQEAEGQPCAFCFAERADASGDAAPQLVQYQGSIDDKYHQEYNLRQGAEYARLVAQLRDAHFPIWDEWRDADDAVAHRVSIRIEDMECHKRDMQLRQEARDSIEALLRQKELVQG